MGFQAMKGLGFQSSQHLVGKESVLFFTALLSEKFALRLDAPPLRTTLILIEDSKL